MAAATVKPRGRALLVSGVDFGNGQRVTAWFSIEFKKEKGGGYRRYVTVRQYRKHRVWALPLNLAAEAVARRAQVRAAEAKLGARP